MDFISNKEQQVKEMLKTIGIHKIEELFNNIPDQLKLNPPDHDDGVSEYEGMTHMEQLGAKNTFPQLSSYLGAGAYQHHVPAITQAVCGKSEFLTSYTPYQPEVSQGMLQSIFEFQSAICALTGMDVANASLYDGASACAEAVLMALRIHKDRNKIALARTLHPHYAAVIEEYVSTHGTEIVWIPFKEDGQIDLQAAYELIDHKTAAVLVQYPNFLGIIDEISEISKYAKAADVLTVVSANPLVYGLYASAAQLGADIAVGDAQPLGLPLNYGGPYVGYIACKQDLVRQMPGRIIGETVDIEGKRGFVLTLQAREQHIRREKATSNICTNQALAALASLVTMLWYGKEGLHKLALTNYQRTAYLKHRLAEIPGLKMLSNAPFFNEFAVSFGIPVELALKQFRAHGIEAGVDLGRFYPELDGYLLVAVTEIKSKYKLDRYVEVARSICSKRE